MAWVAGDVNQFTRLHLEVQGGLVAVARKVNYADKNRPGGGMRGVVMEFSKDSRKRLLRRTARLNATQGVFLTLTYPKRYPNAKIAKSHLRAFLERMRRRFPKSSALWRLEFQERGAPHFHLVFFNIPFIPFWQLRAWWSQIIRQYIDGQKPFVRINYLQGTKAVMSYVSKYVSKAESAASASLFNNGSYLHAVKSGAIPGVLLANLPGRWWGIFNREFLPYAPHVHVSFEQVTDRAFEQVLTRLSLSWPGVDPTWRYGVCVFDPQAYLTFMDLLTIISPDLPKAHAKFEDRSKIYGNSQRFNKKQNRRFSVHLVGSGRNVHEAHKRTDLGTRESITGKEPNL